MDTHQGRKEGIELNTTVCTRISLCSFNIFTVLKYSYIQTQNCHKEAVDMSKTSQGGVRSESFSLSSATQQLHGLEETITQLLWH